MLLLILILISYLRRTVYDSLKDKHPPKYVTDLELVDFHKSLSIFILFFLMVLIRSVALQISGVADLSGLDASWRLYSTSFGFTSADHCDVISAFGYRICIIILCYSF